MPRSTLPTSSFPPPPGSPPPPLIMNNPLYPPPRPRALPPQALSSRSVGLQEAALTLLAMLCSHHDGREQLADSGTLPSISLLLGSQKRDVQRAALAVCQQLCTSRRACDALLEAGAASPLAAMLLSSSAGGTEVRPFL
jgi:hypothetical protein